MAATTPPRKRMNARHRKVGRGTQAYTHWVGAGAVMIGLGAAMATGQGVALAEEPSSEGSTADTTNTGPAGPTNTGPTNIGPAEPVTPNSDPGAPSPRPGDAPTSTVSAQTNTSEETTEEVEEEEDSTETDTTDTETETETETEGDEPIPVTRQSRSFRRPRQHRSSSPKRPRRTTPATHRPSLRRQPVRPPRSRLPSPNPRRPQRH
jgi:hypothetical protein